jgi:ATP-dependent helicase HepA
VMFRNSRRALKGFPPRKVHLQTIAEGTEIKWLAALLKKLKDAKVLLISSSQERAEGIHAALLEEMQVDAGLFHEGLTLLQRDRNAAWFAAEDGARVLICSEIGSEGRNFQFAHHLVLFDLPENPGLLEQRIGRLDRIGQTATIHIHVPTVEGSRGEVLARWYHEGMDAFEKTVHGAAEIAAGVRGELEAALDGRNGRNGSDEKNGMLEQESSHQSHSSHTSHLPGLLKKTKDLRATLEKRLARGYDLLLEKNSCRPALAESIIAPIREADGDAKFEGFVLKLLDRAGVHIEDHAAQLRAAARRFADGRAAGNHRRRAQRHL